MIRKLAAKIPALARSWWVIGLIGWIIVYMNYPIDSVLPLYAE